MQDLREKLDFEHQMFSTAMETYELYKTDHDAPKAIGSMEYVLTNDKYPIWSPRYMHFLVDLYNKTNQDDKAWGYLNWLLTKPDFARPDAVYSEMAWLLKKEKKHAYAIEMYMRSYLEASQSVPFNRGAFLKDIGVPIRALKWSSEDQAEIAKFVEYQVDTKKYDNKEMIQQYRDYYWSHNKE